MYTNLVLSDIYTHMKFHHIIAVLLYACILSSKLLSAADAARKDL